MCPGPWAPAKNGESGGKDPGARPDSSCRKGRIPLSALLRQALPGKTPFTCSISWPPQELTPTPGSWQGWRDVGFPPRALRTGHRLISQRGWDHGQFWKYGRKGRARIQTWFYVKLTQHHVHHLPRPTRTFWPPGWVVVECPRCCNLGLILLPEP